MPPVQDEPRAADDARTADEIRTIRRAAERLNVAVLDSVLHAADGMTAAGAASALGTLARRLAAAADTLDRQLGRGRRG